MPVDINRLTEGWLELESDPGLFTLLLEDFGVKGVQVEEIYDLQKSLEGPVYGFIFLFRWIEERRSRRKVVEQDESFIKDEDVVNNMFFAQQVVPNSCATHALLSVLLNCPNIHLGNTLTRLKQHTTGMSPENKGWAIGNTPELACAHNSHAMPQAKRRQEKNTSVSSGRFTGEAFHFVSYVPINGKLFELDGLKPYPVDHGPWKEDEEWTEQFKRVITDRLGISTGEQLQDIRFNLMAVVPDRRLAISHKLAMLKTNRQIVLEALQQLVKLTIQNKSESSKSGGNDNNTANDNKKNSTNRGNSSCSSSSSNSTSNSSSSSNSSSCSSSGNNSTDDEKVEKTGEKKEKTLEEINDVEMKSEIESTNTMLGQINVDKRVKDVKSDNEEVPKPSTSIATIAEKVVNVCALDYATPLQIQTSPAHSSSSTDTSSEIGWGWNSGQISPTSSKEFKKFVVIKVAADEKTENGLSRSLSNININGKRMLSESTPANKKVCLSGEARIPHARVKTSNGDTVTEEKKVEKIEIEPHTFVPKDLLALLKNLEHEISICEATLKDENDKRTKYKIDDCRRTHNYDEFICTFLSMLAQQGKLAELVQQHLQLKKQPTVSVNRVHRSSKKADAARTTTTRRRRGRTKCKKRK